MKVQLIVVQGKPEGKQIPLAVPRFKIGRGETCHLRPNSELVSREHAEFIVAPDKVLVRDLGSRNGTLVNGKPIHDAFALKNGDLIQVGPLTFAISIQGAGIPAKAGANGGGSTSLDEPANEEIESWLVADNNNPTPDRPSGVFSGDTITIQAYKEGSGSKPTLPTVQAGDVPPQAQAPPPQAQAPPQAPPAKAPAAAPQSGAAPKPAPVAPKPAAKPEADPFEVEYERLPEGEGDEVEEGDPSVETVEGAAYDETSEEFIDESNPFYAAKKKQDEPSAPSKASYKDSSDAANDILRRMMERRRGSRT